MTESDEGGYLVPREYVYGGWEYRSIPSKGWRCVFWIIADILGWIGYYFMRAGQIIAPYGRVTEKIRIKGIYESMEEQGIEINHELPHEPYDDVPFGGEYDHDLH